MEDTGLYQYLLGLKSPWSVSHVGFDVERQHVDVWAEHDEHTAWVCRSPPCTIMQKSDCGDILTAVSLRRFCMHEFLG